MSNFNNSVSNDHGFIGVGTPYFYPDDGSHPFFFGNPVSCKIATSSDKKIRPSRRKRDAGAALDSHVTPKPAEVTISTDTFQPKTWAMAMMGEAGKVTTSQQSVHDETAVAVFDGYHQLKHTDIDPSSMKVKKEGTPLTASQYELNASMGLLQITDPDAAQAGDELIVDYQTKQVTKLVINAAKVTSFKGKMVIDGRNDVTNQPAKLIIHNVSLAVDGDFDWFSDDFNTIEMKGTAAVGKAGEPPYVVELYE